MSARDFQPALFHFSGAAVAMLNKIAADLEKQQGEPVACFGVRCGEFFLNSGARGRGVLIGVWSRSELPAVIAPLIQIVDSVPVHFWVRPEDEPHFSGKVIDWDAAGGAFLREPEVG